MENELATRLLQARSLSGLTQAELADRSGIAPAQISRYELGRNKPRPELAAKLAHALNVSFEWLLYGKGQPQAEGDESDPLKSKFLYEGDAFAEVRARHKSYRDRVMKSGAFRLDSKRLAEYASWLQDIQSRYSAISSALETLEGADVEFDGMEEMRSSLEDMHSEATQIEAAILELVERAFGSSEELTLSKSASPRDLK